MSHPDFITWIMYLGIFEVSVIVLVIALCHINIEN